MFVCRFPDIYFRSGAIKFTIMAETVKQQREELERSEGIDLLKDFCAVGFRSDINAAALALGHEPEQIRSMLNGETPVDDDLEMKMRGIAQERNFGI